MPVYFIRAGETGPIKIGFAKNPERRIHNLQIGSVDRLRLLAVIDEEEAALHERFAAHRIRGEWFAPAPEILALAAVLHAHERARTRKNPAGGHLHAAFIDLLGGSGVLASRLGIRQQVTSNWKVRGVSWRYRTVLSDLAQACRVPLPEGFLEPTTTKAAS